MLAVYLVEDDAVLARHLLQVFEAADGIRCVGHAATLADARQELPRCRPQLLLTDMELPDGQGSSLVAWLRATQPDWQPQILAWSVFADEPRVMAALEAGADGYLLKGGPDADLLDALHGVADGGSPITPGLARTLLRRFGPAPAGGTATAAPALNPAEHTVLKLSARGYTPGEIASEAALDTPLAVARQIRGVYARLRAGAAATAGWTAAPQA